MKIHFHFPVWHSFFSIDPFQHSFIFPSIVAFSFSFHLCFTSSPAKYYFWISQIFLNMSPPLPARQCVCVYDLEPCGCWLTRWLTRRYMHSEGSVTSQEMCIFCWTSCCCLLAAGQIKQYMMLLSSWRAKQMVFQTARDPQPTCCAGLL